jgi:hypothetical protein
MNEHPVSLHVMDDLRRSRLTVFFRLLLAIPHFIWITLWTIVLLIVFLLNWLVALVIGRPAGPLHRFTAAYLRYATTVNAYVYLAANPFPGFTGEPGRYPIELQLPEKPEKQNRLKTLFRLLLAYPALIVNGALGYSMYAVLFLGWWAALFTGRMPRGFRDLAANYLRYSGQVNAYMFLATGSYPNASPYVGISLGGPTPPEVPAEPAPVS